MKSTFRHLAFSLAAASLFATSALAQTTWSNPGTGDWYTGTNWSDGAPTGSTSATIGLGGTSTISSGSASAGLVILGDTTGTGALNLTGGSLTTGSHLVLGTIGGNQGSLTVSGSNTSLTIGQNLAIGDSSAGVFTLSAGQVTALVATLGGGNIAASGTATVSGGHLEIYQALVVGSSGGPGVLNISGGSVTSYTGYVGMAGAAQATVSGGRWDVTANMLVGGSAGGELVISGGTVTSNRGVIGDAGSGTATVTVTAGRWEVANDIVVGESATGALHVSGGVVSSGSTVYASGTSHSGAITVTNGGVIEAQNIARGAASGTLELGQGGTLRATADSADFITGFATDEIVLNAGAGVIDTNGHEVTTSASFSGTLGGTGTAGAVLVQDGGVLTAGDGGTGHLTIHQAAIVNPGGTVLLEFSGTGAGLFDQITIPTFGVSGDSTLNLQILDGYTPIVGDSFQVLTNGITVGSFDHIVTNLGSNFQWNLSRLGSEGIVSIAPTVLPEPSTWALLGLGGATLLLTLRRRKSSR